MTAWDRPTEDILADLSEAVEGPVSVTWRPNRRDWSVTARVGDEARLVGTSSTSLAWAAHCLLEQLGGPVVMRVVM